MRDFEDALEITIEAEGYGHYEGWRDLGDVDVEIDDKGLIGGTVTYRTRLKFYKEDDNGRVFAYLDVDTDTEKYNMQYHYQKVDLRKSQFGFFMQDAVDNFVDQNIPMV